MSLLRAHGHPDVLNYRIGYLFDEANLVTERENARMSTEAQLVQMAASGLVSAKGGKQFQKMLKHLTIETEPIAGLFDQD